MDKSFVISMVIIANNHVQYFKQFDAIGNILTTDSVFDAFNFGFDEESANYVIEHILREYSLTGETRYLHINVLDVYLNQDETPTGIQLQERK